MSIVGVGFLVLGIIVIGCVFYKWFHHQKELVSRVDKISDMLVEWAEGLSKVSGISFEEIWTMPSSEIEKLRKKYNYK